MHRWYNGCRYCFASKHAELLDYQEQAKKGLLFCCAGQAGRHTRAGRKDQSRQEGSEQAGRIRAEQAHQSRQEGSEQSRHTRAGTPEQAGRIRAGRKDQSRQEGSEQAGKARPARLLNFSQARSYKARARPGHC